MLGLRHDLRFAWRELSLRRGWTLAVVSVLGLGMASSGVAVSLLNALFLRPMPFEAPERLVRIYSGRPEGFRYFTVSYPDFLDIYDLEAVFSGVVAEKPLALGATGAHIARLILGETMRLVAVGVAAGVGIGLAAWRSASSLLYGADRVEGFSLLVALLVLAATVLVASSLPVLRAIRLQPARCLRQE